jgi:hypothetical protein
MGSIFRWKYAIPGRRPDEPLVFDFVDRGLDHPITGDVIESFVEFFARVIGTAVDIEVFSSSQGV